MIKKKYKSRNRKIHNMMIIGPIFRDITNFLALSSLVIIVRHKLNSIVPKVERLFSVLL